MSLIKRIFLLLCMASLSSCTDFWDGSTQRKFHEACAGEAVKWAGTPEKADVYCNCVLEKMMKKYPNEDDAFGHLGDLSKDTSLINCKDAVMNK